MAEEKEGFFKKFHETVNSSIDEVTRNNFANLESNDKRVSYLCRLPAIKEYDLASDLEQYKSGGQFPFVKDMEKARLCKNEGNNAVQRGDWGQALIMYNLSLLNMPEKEAEEKSIVLANRSAALVHLGLHEDAMSDIQRCLALGYPKHLRYKVLERRARCLLLQKRNREAISAFQATIQALDEAKGLDATKKQKQITDSKIMLEMLNKGLSLAGNPKDPQILKKTPPRPKLTGKANPQYPAASAAIQIDYDAVRGRYATATRDIEVGEIVMVEKPHSGVLLAEFSKTHCQYCFLKCPIPLACPTCPNVVFCSDKCLETAMKTYHGYECSILPLLWKSGCSVTCLIAFRMITQAQKDYFININKELEVKPQGPYKTEDYRNIIHLVSHEDKRTMEDLIHRSQMVAFLLKMLELSGYFDGKPRHQSVSLDEIKTMAVQEKYKEDIALFGSLLLKNLQILQFNAHEVFELVCPTPKTVGSNVIKHNGKSTFLAGAVFPTLALINHSCDPSVTRYFCGSSIVMRTVKSIKKGAEVSDNYGPIFTTVPKEQRQATLKEQYWFDCGCVPCQQDWPLFEEMNETYMRFKCNSDNPCSNVVAVPYDCKEFMVQCGLCHQYTNILKGLKSLQDTDLAYRLGCASMEEGKYGDAMKKFIEVLKLYDETLAPPYRSYYECVQELRRCMLSLGNYSIV